MTVTNKTILLATACIAILLMAPAANAQAEWGMTYQLKIIRGAFSTNVDWDAGSGPDVKVRVTLDGRSYETSKVQDNYSPTWNATFQVVINENSNMSLRFIECDMMSDDDLGGWSNVTFTLDRLNQLATPQRWEHTDNVGNVDYWVEIQLTPVAGTSPAELAAARPITAVQMVGWLAGKQVGSWTFEASEPREVEIVSIQSDGRNAVVDFDITTNSVDGSQPAAGRVRAYLNWNNNRWNITRLENISFALQ